MNVSLIGQIIVQSKYPGVHMVTLSRSLKINKNIEKVQKHYVKYLDNRDLFLALDQPLTLLWGC